MAETPITPVTPVLTLAQAAQRLETGTRALANLARQHGFFTAAGRDLFFTAEQIKALKALLKDKARAEERAAAARRKPKKTFGIHESSELRKERRRAKKRQVKKDTDS